MAETVRITALTSLEVSDPDGVARYARDAGETLRTHGGELLAAQAQSISVEGQVELTSVALVGFPDLGSLRRWYDSADYRPWRQIRQAGAPTRAVIFESAQLGSAQV